VEQTQNNPTARNEMKIKFNPLTTQRVIQNASQTFSRREDYFRIISSPDYPTSVTIGEGEDLVEMHGVSDTELAETEGENGEIAKMIWKWMSEEALPWDTY